MTQTERGCHGSGRQEQDRKDNTGSKARGRDSHETVAVGISLVLNCESCLEWHIHEALKDGATEDEVLEALEVGIEMQGGPATVSARFALKVLEYYRETGL
jgi:AhpD family alkylhydroperoxidase